MIESALRHDCDANGCAAKVLAPKLRAFDHCFPGRIAMGDIDMSVERNGWILLVEWKRGTQTLGFVQRNRPQVRQAQAFTLNSPRQTFIFALGDSLSMDVAAFRVMRNGDWLHGWQKGRERFEQYLKSWSAFAEAQEPLNAPRLES